MKKWSDGVFESWNVESLWIRASLQYSSTPIFRFRLCLILCGILFALCSSVDAQQAGKIFRIGFLDNNTAAGSAGLLDVFRRELLKLGWIERKNITIESLFTEQKSERLPELAADLVRFKVDLIVATVTRVALAAKKATTTIPTVVVSAGDPVAAGLVTSLARPGGNITIR